MDEYPLGRSKEERRYRQWCLRNRLFLNALNDLGPHSIAAGDGMLLPSHRAEIAADPVFVDFFNQMKQQFTAARFLYFESVHADGRHFADGRVRLLNTLDYQLHSLSTEKLRLSFRSTYSLFDKIAAFLNSYLELGIDPKGVSFRSLWYERAKIGNWKIRTRFVAYANVPLRGLFWLAKDLSADNPDMREAIEPEARNLKVIRNHLEHKFLSIHELLLKDEGGDDLAYALSRSSMEDKGLRLLKLARSALMYLSLGMQREEQLRKQDEPQNGFVVPMELPILPDHWKRRF